MRLLVTFYSISAALLVEAAGKERGFPCALIPTPRTLGSSCGYAAELETEDARSLAGMLKGLGAEWEALWQQRAGTYEAILP